MGVLGIRSNSGRRALSFKSTPSNGSASLTRGAPRSGAQSVRYESWPRSDVRERSFYPTGRNPATMNSATLVHIAVYPHRSSHRATVGPIRSRLATVSAPRVAKPAPMIASAMMFGRWVICPSKSRITRRPRQGRRSGPGLLPDQGHGRRRGDSERALPAVAVPAPSPREPLKPAGPLNRGGRSPPRARSAPRRPHRSSSLPPRGESRAPRACSRRPRECSACGTRAGAGG